MNLYRNINRKNIQFDFVVHTNEICAFDEEIKQLGGKIYIVPKYKGINHFEYMKVWKHIFESNPQYKIIHGHVRSTASIYLNIAKLYNLTTIAHSHNSSSGIGIRAIIKDILQYPIRFTADYFIACSMSAGKWLFGRRIVESENFFVLNNAIEVERFRFNSYLRKNIRNELNLEDKFVIGHIGRFHPQKNHDFLVEVFNRIYAMDNNSVLLLVGDGALKSEIQLKVKNLCLEKNVIFTGVRSDVQEILQAMDVFLFPSLYEGLPVILIEAQASGLIIFASDKITRDVDITSNIFFTSLDSDLDVWAKKILSYRNGYSRRNTSVEINVTGYDVKSNAEELESFYLSL
jgi:glycosyltransferase involved in cell wall biosynthesis